MSRKKSPKPSPHPDLKYTAHAYGWMLLAAMMILAGISIVRSGEFRGRTGSMPIRGEGASFIGWGFIGYGAYLGYIVLYRARKTELAQKDFHELKPFKKTICDYTTEFRITRDTYSRGGHGAGTPVFYYKVQLGLKNKSLPSFKINRRGRIGLVLWHLGPGRIGDILTGSTYFDAHYRVAGADKTAIRLMLSLELVESLSAFDRDYPPILTKNGWLSVDNNTVRYTEGPYPEDQKLFTMHRGRLDLLVAALLPLAEKFDSSHGKHIRGQFLTFDIGHPEDVCDHTSMPLKH